MKEHISHYKKELEKAICEYMEGSVNERSANAIHTMLICLDDLEDREYKADDFTCEDAKHWVNNMINSDGTRGAKWSMEETTSVANSMGIKFEHITDYCWWATMNMMYSDYYSVASELGVSTTNFYASMAQAFLFDKDGGGPKKKLTAYYNYIVK